MYNSSEPSMFKNGVLSFFAGLDFVIYNFLALIYVIFFNVASVQILTGPVMTNFMGRIQIIIGVFMIFKISISIFNGIVNPDALIAGKDENGVSKMVVRICVSLIMLTLIMPIRIPDNGSLNKWEQQINSNGILFGTLYDLQDRILINNTIGKLILGTPQVSGMREGDESNQINQIENLGIKFAADVLKTFISPSLDPDAEAVKNYNGGSITDIYDDTSNWVCSEGDEDVWKEYYLDEGTPIGFLTDATTLECGSKVIPWALGDAAYAFNYMLLVSTLVGIVLTAFLIMITVDVAIRVIKLAVLRILAPIPIISYIDPKSQKDGSFANWVKALTSTYLDLFLHLVIIFFVLFILSDFVNNGQVVPNSNNMFVTLVAKIFIYIGLFFFIKQAPKFIKDMLGVKSTGGSLGLGGLLAGTAALVGGAGLAGAGAAMLSGMDTVNEAKSQGKQAPGGWSMGRDMAAQMRTGDPKAKGGYFNKLVANRTKTAGLREAAKYGVTGETVDAAKTNMFKAKDRAARTADDYKRFNDNKLSSDEQDWLTAQMVNQNIDNNRNGRPTIDMNDADAVREASRQFLEKRMESSQAAAGKAESNYKKASDYFDKHGGDQRFDQEFKKQGAKYRAMNNSRIVKGVQYVSDPGYREQTKQTKEANKSTEWKPE